MTGQILAAKAWKSNGELIADVFSLHVKNPHAHVVDSTYGEGTFWNNIQPEVFSAFDLNKPRKATATTPAVRKRDWGDLPFDDDVVDVVVFDPPYVSRGGRKTSTIPGMVEAYGMDDAAHSPEALWSDITRGIDEAARILRPKGLLLLKVQNYISSGHMVQALRWAFESFDDNRLEVHDWFTLVGGTGPQPTTTKCKRCTVDPERIGIVQSFVNGEYVDATCSNCGGRGEKDRRQVHARQNASHLLVGRKRPPKRTRK